MFGRRSWRFTTTLSPGQCAERLRSAIDGNFSFYGSKAVMGRVRPQGAILRKRLFFRTPYQAVVRVAFQSSGDGARITCEARADAFSVIFAGAWSGFLLLTGGILAVLKLGGAIAPTSGTPWIVMFLMPLVMVALAVLLPWLGYRSANRHAVFVADFVERLLGADDGVPVAGETGLEKVS